MRFAAIVAYDGSGYAGWQKQVNSHGIQSDMEKALGKIHKHPTLVTASGRTDAGVHALGQVVHFDGEASIGCRGYYNALNTLLEKDVRVVRVCQVPDDFHARFSARKKQYEYICTYDTDNPFIHRYKHVLRRPHDVQAMKNAAQVFVGTHDFTTFCNAQIAQEKSRVKTIDSIDIEEDGKDIRFVFTGDGFLRYQVRMMSAVILAAGLGRLQPEEIEAMLEAKDKEASRHNAPACGLYLARVGYDFDLEKQPGWPETLADDVNSEE